MRINFRIFFLLSLVVNIIPLYAQTIFTNPITGVQLNDQVSGSGRYVPGYTITNDGTYLHFIFGLKDTIAVNESSDTVLGVNATTLSSPFYLEPASNGTLTISVERTLSSVNCISGCAAGMSVNGDTLIVSGPINIYPSERNSNPTGVAFGVWSTASSTGKSKIVFNEPVYIEVNTTGLGRGIYTRDYSSIVFNKDASIATQSRYTNWGVYTANGASAIFHGNLNAACTSPNPSDDINVLYNDNINSLIQIDGNVTISGVSHGSTVMGIRSQGYFSVKGTTTIDISGPRTVIGINTTHFQEKSVFTGDITAKIRGGINTFGDSEGIQSRAGGSGNEGYIRLEGSVIMDIASTGTHAYGIHNTGKMTITSSSAIVSLKTATTAAGKNTYGISNTDSLSMAGSLDISASATPTGKIYSLWTRPENAAIVNARTYINQNGKASVKLNGDIATGIDTINNKTGTIYLTMNTADSYLNGLVVSVENSKGGAANISMGNGAVWKPAGNGTLINDFGSGKLHLGFSVIDMGAFWGKFTSDTIPACSCRTLIVNSTNSTAGATVNLSDSATFQIISDIKGKSGKCAADKIVFNNGIKTFSSTGVHNVAITFDPVLADTHLVNPYSIKNALFIAADSHMVIIDVSDAANGTAQLSSVKAVLKQWSSTYQNAPFSFSYSPQVALSLDKKQIVLEGISITNTTVIKPHRIKPVNMKTDAMHYKIYSANGKLVRSLLVNNTKLSDCKRTLSPGVYYFKCTENNSANIQHTKAILIGDK